MNATDYEELMLLRKQARKREGEEDAWSLFGFWLGVIISGGILLAAISFGVINK